MHAVRSASGMLAQIPSSPKKCGRMKIKGSRQWTVSDIQKLVEVLDITYEELYK